MNLRCCWRLGNVRKQVKIEREGGVGTCSFRSASGNVHVNSRDALACGFLLFTALSLSSSFPNLEF